MKFLIKLFLVSLNGTVAMFGAMGSDNHGNLCTPGNKYSKNYKNPLDKVSVRNMLKKLSTYPYGSAKPGGQEMYN